MKAIKNIISTLIIVFLVIVLGSLVIVAKIHTPEIEIPSSVKQAIEEPIELNEQINEIFSSWDNEKGEMKISEQMVNSIVAKYVEEIKVDQATINYTYVEFHENLVDFNIHVTMQEPQKFPTLIHGTISFDYLNTEEEMLFKLESLELGSFNVPRFAIEKGLNQLEDQGRLEILELYGALDQKELSFTYDFSSVKEKLSFFVDIDDIKISEDNVYIKVNKSAE